MGSIHGILVAYLLATTTSAYAYPRAPLDLEPVNATLVGPRFNQRYDQMRLMTCSTYRQPERKDRLIGYYSHPPGSAEKPTQIAYYEKGASPSWENGCHGSSDTHGKSSDGAEWKCDIPKYTWDERKYFKKFMGTITYGHTGFNCFHDDGHATHYQSDGVCYSELYCTHERYQSLAMHASKKTSKPEYRVNGLEAGKKPNIPTDTTKALVRSYLQKIKDNVGDQQCSGDPVPLTTNCNAVLRCEGAEPRYLKKLADALITAYENEKNDKDEVLYSGYESKKCFPQPTLCDPRRPGCFMRPDLCDYVKGVEMPSKFITSLYSKVPPKADEENGEISIQLAQLTVDIQCGAERDNDLMCGALKTLFTGLSMFPPMAVIFGAAALGTEVACM